MAMMRIATGTVLALPIRSFIYHQLSILIFGIGVWVLAST